MTESGLSEGAKVEDHENLLAAGNCDIEPPARFAHFGIVLVTGTSVVPEKNQPVAAAAPVGHVTHGRAGSPGMWHAGVAVCLRPDFRFFDESSRLVLPETRAFSCCADTLP